MCHSYKKNQRRLKARKRASKDKPAQRCERDRLIARAVAMARFVLSELDLKHSP